jgi:hypothetical protein
MRSLPDPPRSSGMNMSYPRAAARLGTHMTRLLGTDPAVYNISLGRGRARRSCGPGRRPGDVLGLVETIRELTGQALCVRVRDPRLGLVSGYGMVTYDRSVCSGAAILGA